LYGDFNSDGLDQLHGIPAIALLACTFASLIWLASREVRHKRLQKERRRVHEMKEREATHLPPEMAKTGT
jgi:hypothetical protein